MRRNNRTKPQTIIINHEAKKKYVNGTVDVFFKVVTIHFGELRSSAAYGKAMVRYEEKKWVTPPQWLAEKGYGLLVFHNFEDALHYAMDLGLRCAIYACKVKGIISPMPPFCSLDDLAYGEIKAISSEWIPSTVMVKKLKLIEKIAEIM